MNTSFINTFTLDHIIDQLSENEHAFACWRLPKENNIKLIVDLGEPSNTEIDTLGEKSGFLVNYFIHHHPICPVFIRPHITIHLSNTFTVMPDSANLKQVNLLQSLLKEKKQKKKMVAENISSDYAFEDGVAKAKKKIQQGNFIKVVLSRCKKKRLPLHFSILEFYRRICYNYPDAFCSIFYLPKEGVWVGASPEVLIDSDSKYFRTMSLAGTKKVHPNEPNNRISWTQKEIEEQAMVSRYIVDCFKHLRVREFEEDGPKTIKIGHLAHLKTEFKVNLKKVSHENLGYKMLNLLHPTSAVCGMPLDPAEKFIQTLEPFERKYYAGFVGPIEPNNTAKLYVNLRCVNIKNKDAYFFAGAGITIDSEPNKEKNETELKMKVLMDLLY